MSWRTKLSKKKNRKKIEKKSQSHRLLSYREHSCSPFLCEFPDKGLELLVREAVRAPIEARTEVVDEHPIKKEFKEIDQPRTT